MAKYEEVMLSLRQGKYAQVYMLCGTEPYYIDKVSDWIEDNVLGVAAREFDQIVMYGKDLQPANSPGIAPVVAAARGFAMSNYHFAHELCDLVAMWYISTTCILSLDIAPYT